MVKRRKSSFRGLEIKPKKIILTIIILATLVVALTVIMIAFLNPERQVKSKVESLASNYYENIIYQDLVTSDTFSGDIESALQKYTEKGLPRVNLRQLLLNTKNVPTADYDYLTKHCDIEKTFVQFFPESPFASTNYRVDYTYSCNF